MASKKGNKFNKKLLLSFILLSDLLMLTVARPDPSIESENESEEAYYGPDGGSNSDSLREDEETALNEEDQNPAALEQQEPDSIQQVNLHEKVKETDSQAAAEKFSDSDHANLDDFNSDTKENDNTMIADDGFQSFSKRREKTYNDNQEPNDELENNFSGREVYRVDHRKNIGSISKNHEDSAKHFEDVESLNDQRLDHSRRNRMRKNSQSLPNRGRRQVQETTQKDINLSTLKGESEEISENDEVAIKNQIKELSNQELDELLNSLSEDKRHLLKKILDDNAEEPVKREITKKAGAGAVEENNCMDGGQIDMSEPGASGLSITASSTDPPDLVSNSTDNVPKMTTVPPKTDSKIQLTNNDLINSKEKGVEGNSAGALNTDATLNTAVDDKTESKDKEESKEKNDYKREAKANEFENTYSSEDMVCPDDLSEILNEETELESNRNSYKREATQNDAELTGAMKSLEESFPNSKNYDEPSVDPSNMAPLVRVKRKNDEIKKRSVNISPSDYNSENEDEDNEEASEFDDEGYNEHQSNLEKNFANKPKEEVPLVEETKESSQDVPFSPAEQSCYDNSQKEHDAVNLGTDSDSVISGVEGVDENLMYNGVSRNKRNMERFYKPEVDLNRFLQTTSIVDNNLQPAADKVQLGNFQENDAFGPLPRNYEGDLGRYKRVRQIKQ